MRKWKNIVALILLSISAVNRAENQPILQPLENFPRTQLTIATPNARLHRFNVWIADDNKRREQGLMLVKAMPADGGMLFLYERPQLITMWMKNTLIPLDMLFIRADGHIARIAENTTPMSEKHIESKENVVGVLELNAGSAARLGIQAGAIVMHRAFGNDEAK